MRNCATFLSNKARNDYYINFITENSTDQRRLFRASKSLLNLSKCSGFQYLPMIISLLMILENFFAQKIADIRSDIRSVSTKQICTVTVSCFSEFYLLSESEVFDLITASPKKSCSIDLIPTKLLNECIDVLLPSMTKIINLSLDSSYFPRTWKRALV